MKKLQLIYCQLQVIFLDFQIDFYSMFICKGWISEIEYKKAFVVYIQRKDILNKRIQRLGGAV